MYQRVLVLMLFGFGCLQLWAAALGMRRTELRSLEGRQLAALVGRRGAIAIWLILGIVLIATSVILGLRVFGRT